MQKSRIDTYLSIKWN